MKTHFNLKAVFTVTVVSILYSASVHAADDSLVAWWKFDASEQRAVTDSVTGSDDEVLGYFKYVPGASGDALRFDGYSTALRRKATDAPKLGKSFSFEAWVAFQAYPWGLCAIVSQRDTEDISYAMRGAGGEFPPVKDPSAGYYFAVDARGRVHLQVSVNGAWIGCQSEARVPLMEWAHIAGTYDAEDRPE